MNTLLGVTPSRDIFFLLGEYAHCKTSGKAANKPGDYRRWQAVAEVAATQNIGQRKPRAYSNDCEKKEKHFASFPDAFVNAVIKIVHDAQRQLGDRLDDTP